MATNSSVQKTITIRVDGGQATATMDDMTLSTKQLNTELKNLSFNAGKSKPKGNASGGATATVLELGRTISDANYGIRGMANNLSQLVSNLVFTTKAAGGLGAGLKSIWSALMGPLGLILAFQGIIALLESFAMKSKDASDAADELNKSLKNEISLLKVYVNVLNSSTISLDKRIAALKGASKLDKELSKALKEANGDREKEAEILHEYLEDKKLELAIKEKEAEVLEALNIAKEAQAKVDENIGDNSERYFRILAGNSGTSRQYAEDEKERNITRKNANNLAHEYLELLGKLDEKEEEVSTKKKTREKKAKAPVFGDPIFDVDALIEGYDESKTLEFDLRRRYLDSRALFYDEARIQASESNNRILEDEIAHREKMLIQTEVGSLERIQAENELAMMRMDLLDQEFEHEMLLLDLKMQAQMEYVGFVTGIGDVLAGLGKRSEELATLSLVVQKGAAIAEVVIAASQSIAARMAAHALIPPFITMPMGISIPNPVKAIDAAAMGKDITMTKVGAGISIAAILATAIKGGKRSITSGGGRAGGAEGAGGGRTFDFNLVGSTGTNQLAEAVGAQFQEPIQAFVVSSQVTSQQELDLEISTGASLGG